MAALPLAAMKRGPVSSAHGQPGPDALAAASSGRAKVAILTVPSARDKRNRARQ